MFINDDKQITSIENDPISFNDIFKEMYPACCSFAKKFIIDSSEAEDVVQDIFVKLWDKIPK